MKKRQTYYAIITTKEVSYHISEARTELLKEIESAHQGSTCNTFKDHELACCETAFKIIRRRLNLRGRVRRK